MARAIIKKTRESRVYSGHPWIFRSDVVEVDGRVSPGDVVEVASWRGTFLGKAFYNPNSMITLRMLTYRDEPVDAAFFARRARAAWEYRVRVADTGSCRAVYSESDFLPGLIVDKFSDVLVVQSLSLGIDRWKMAVVDELMALTGAVGAYERSDAPVRRLEGMEELAGLMAGEIRDEVLIEENGVKSIVDVKRGQKTGYFLDQKQNRAAVAPLCRGERVLDCFCHNGSFGLNAAAGGAREVVGVDISEEALRVAERNAGLNGINNISFVAGNCFDYLREAVSAREEYGVVILDPPAFAKNRASVEGALRGYKEINMRGMKLTADGGFLVSCSCSQHVSDGQFMDMLVSAARDSKVRLRLLEMRTQAIDHPILPAASETKYLKCAITQVIR